MRYKLFATNLLLSSLCLSATTGQAATNEELEERVIQLESQLKKSDVKTKKRISSLKNAVENSQNKLRISGFMTVGVNTATADVTSRDGQNVFSEEFTYRTDAKVGLQFDYRMTDDWSATVQLASKGKDDWSTKAEWAFLRWDSLDWLTLRAGRLRIPLFMYSETLDVGFTYPWSRPPIGFYITSVSSYEGLDALIRFETGPLAHQFQPYVGASEGILPNGFHIKGNNIYGLAYEASWSNFSARLSAVQLDSGLSSEAFSELLVDAVDGGFLTPGEADDVEQRLLEGEKIRFYSAGVRYDNGSLLILSEYSRTDSGGFPTRDTEAAYATVGYTIGKWQPYVSYVVENTLHESDIAPLLVFTKIAAPIQSKSTTLGVRYDINSNVSIKLQGEHYYDFEDTGGVWQGSFPRGGFVQEFPGEEDIYSLTIDAVF